MDNASNRLLDRLARRHGTATNYGLAKLFGADPSRIRNYRRGTSQMDDAVAVRAAELLDEDPAAILAELHAERCKSPAAKKQWVRIAKMIRSAARHQSHH